MPTVPRGQGGQVVAGGVQAPTGPKRDDSSRPNRPRRRGDGMRLRITAIPGVTRGDAARILKKPFYFQCPPLDSFSHDHGFTVNRRTNYQGDEYADRGGKKLVSTTFRTIIVEWGSFVVERNFNVHGLVDKLIEISEAGYPIRFLATHAYNDDPELDIKAFLEDVRVTEEAGEQDARYLDITITQWRKQTGRRRDSEDRREGGKDWPKTLTIRANGHANWPSQMSTGGAAFGESLEDKGKVTFSEIAMAAYGKPSLAKHIAAAQKPPIRDFGMHTPLEQHPRFKDGGKLIIPAPPKRDEAEDEYKAPPVIKGDRELWRASRDGRT